MPRHLKIGVSSCQRQVPRQQYEIPLPTLKYPSSRLLLMTGRGPTSQALVAALQKILTSSHQKLYRAVVNPSQPLYFWTLTMASRSCSRALRSFLTHQLTSPATQRRTLISAPKYFRTDLAALLKPAFVATVQQTRGIKTIDFAGTKEVVYGDSFSQQIQASCRMLMRMQSARIGR